MVFPVEPCEAIVAGYKLGESCVGEDGSCDGCCIGCLSMLEAEA
jgi:hypothetical protein